MSDLSYIFETSKVQCYQDRLRQLRRGDTCQPITMELDITTDCNHGCPACTGGSYKGTLDFDSICSYLVQLSDYELCGITFTGGGEPLMHPQAVEAVEYAKWLGLDVGLITNGTILRQPEALLASCTWIRVSLDASDAEMHKETHGVKGKFEGVLSNVGSMVGTKIISESDCTIGVGYLTGRATVHGMVEAAKLAKELGVDYIQFRPFHEDRTDVSEQLVECRQHETNHFRVLSSAHKYGHFGEEDRPYTGCLAAQLVGTVQADHHVTLCCHTRGLREFYLGDLRRQTFKEIWEGRRKKWILDRLDVAKCLPFCRGDGINRELCVSTSPPHAAFL